MNFLSCSSEPCSSGGTIILPSSSISNPASLYKSDSPKTFSPNASGFLALLVNLKKSILSNCTRLFVSSNPAITSVWSCSNSCLLGIFVNCFVIPSSILTTNVAIASVKNLPTDNNFINKVINPANLGSIGNNFVVNQPIITIPTRSSILPRNPLVLFCKIVPSLFVAPCNVDASISSSLSFLRTFSLLLAKNLPSSLIKLLLKTLL